MKKIFLVLAVTLTGLTGFAQTSAKIKSGDVSVYSAQSIELLEVRVKAPTNCPDTAMCAPATFAKIKITLSGCLDRLMMVSHNFTQGAEGKSILNVSAIAAGTKKSMSVRCFMAPFEIKEIFIGPAYITKESVQLNVLN